MVLKLRHVFLTIYAFTTLASAKTKTSKVPDSSYRQNVANYDKEYVVADPIAKTNFGHREQRVGDETQGFYFQRMPDGRTQRVTYFVSGDSGFNADVQYVKSAASSGPQSIPPPVKLLQKQKHLQQRKFQNRQHKKPDLHQQQSKPNQQKQQTNRPVQQRHKFIKKFADQQISLQSNKENAQPVNRIKTKFGGLEKEKVKSIPNQQHRTHGKLQPSNEAFLQAILNREQSLQDGKQLLLGPKKLGLKAQNFDSDIQNIGEPTQQVALGLQQPEQTSQLLAENVDVEEVLETLLESQQLQQQLRQLGQQSNTGTQSDSNIQNVGQLTQQVAPVLQQPEQIGQLLAEDVDLEEVLETLLESQQLQQQLRQLGQQSDIGAQLDSNIRNVGQLTQQVASGIQQPQQISQLFAEGVDIEEALEILLESQQLQQQLRQSTQQSGNGAQELSPGKPLPILGEQQFGQTSPLLGQVNQQTNTGAERGGPGRGQAAQQQLILRGQQLDKQLGQQSGTGAQLAGQGGILTDQNIQLLLGDAQISQGVHQFGQIGQPSATGAQISIDERIPANQDIQLILGGQHVGQSVQPLSQFNQQTGSAALSLAPATSPIEQDIQLILGRHQSGQDLQQLGQGVQQQLLQQLIPTGQRTSQNTLAIDQEIQKILDGLKSSQDIQQIGQLNQFGQEILPADHQVQFLSGQGDQKLVKLIQQPTIGNQQFGPATLSIPTDQDLQLILTGQGQSTQQLGQLGIQSITGLPHTEQDIQLILGGQQPRKGVQQLDQLGQLPVTGVQQFGQRGIPNRQNILLTQGGLQPGQLAQQLGQLSLQPLTGVKQLGQGRKPNEQNILFTQGGLQSGQVAHQLGQLGQQTLTGEQQFAQRGIPNKQNLLLAQGGLQSAQVAQQLGQLGEQTLTGLQQFAQGGIPNEQNLQLAQGGLQPAQVAQQLGQLSQQTLTGLQQFVQGGIPNEQNLQLVQGGLQSAQVAQQLGQLGLQPSSKFQTFGQDILPTNKDIQFLLGGHQSGQNIPGLGQLSQQLSPVAQQVGQRNLPSSLNKGLDARGKEFALNKQQLHQGLDSNNLKLSQGRFNEVNFSPRHIGSTFSQPPAARGVQRIPHANQFGNRGGSPKSHNNQQFNPRGRQLVHRYKQNAQRSKLNSQQIQQQFGQSHTQTGRYPKYQYNQRGRQRASLVRVLPSFVDRQQFQPL